MTIKMKMNDPEKAREFFSEKITYTTGPAELKTFMEKGEPPLIIDVRRSEDFEKGHIPGAINIPKEKWKESNQLSKEKMNLIYCYTTVCHLAATAALEFASRGFPVMELSGGIAEWKNYGYDTQRSPAMEKSA